MTKKVALVLSGGGSKGLAHIGVINELEKKDLKYPLFQAHLLVP